MGVGNQQQTRQVSVRADDPRNFVNSQAHVVESNNDENMFSSDRFDDSPMPDVSNLKKNDTNGIIQFPSSSVLD